MTENILIEETLISNLKEDLTEDKPKLDYVQILITLTFWLGIALVAASLILSSSMLT